MTKNEQLITDTIQRANQVFGFDVCTKTRRQEYVYARAIVTIHLSTLGVPHKVIANHIGVNRATALWYLNMYSNVDVTYYEFNEMVERFNS